MKKPRLIGSILEQTLKSLELDVSLKNYSLFGAWEEIVGEVIARQAQPRSIRNRILFIDVSHPTWVQQLQFLKPNLLQKINTHLGEPRIQDIRFRLGKIESSSSPLRNVPLPHMEKCDEAMLQRMEGLLKKIEDEEMRKALRSVFTRGAALERYRREKKPE